MSRAAQRKKTRWVERKLVNLMGVRFMPPRTKLIRAAMSGKLVQSRIK